MKRIIVFVLVIALAVSAAACSVSVSSGGATEAPTGSTEASAAATEVPTAAVTDAPGPTLNIVTEPPKSDSGYSAYTEPNGYWQVTVPDIWSELGIIVEYKDGYNSCVKFAYEDAYNDGAGHVFTIVMCVNPSDFVDVENLPHAEELYRSPDFQVYVVYPTDVQFGVYDDPSSDRFQRQKEEYGELYDTREDIIDSFTWLK